MSAAAGAWNFGLCATRSREPRQARKGATVSGSPRVPQITRSSSHRKAVLQSSVGGRQPSSRECIGDVSWSYSAYAFLWLALRLCFLCFGLRNRAGVRNSLTRYELSSYSPEVAPANIQRPSRTIPRHVDAGKRHQKRPRSACVYFFGRARRRKNYGGADSCESTELCEGADRGALRRV